MSAPASPRIASFSWGRIEITGHGRFKDVVLFPGGAREWDWRDCGTGHEQGIQPAAVQELIDRGVEVVVLARGVLGRLRVAPAVLMQLHELEIEVHALKTEEAVPAYNELARTRRVGGLFHSTC